jgi:hypothetical protein
MAPEISAGVMMANMSWKQATANSGTPVLPYSVALDPLWIPVDIPCIPHCTKVPQKPFPFASFALPNDTDHPYSTHATVTIAIQMKFIISMFSTLFARTMPP